MGKVAGCRADSPSYFAGGGRRGFGALVFGTTTAGGAASVGGVGAWSAGSIVVRS